MGSVVNVKASWSGRTSTQSGGGRTAKRGWTVLFDAPADDAEIQARTAAGIPRRNDPHPHDSWMIANSITASPMDSQILWEVVATYKAEYAGDSSDPTASPLDAPWEYSYGFASTTEPIDDDADGKPIQTAVGESYDPPLTREFADPVLTITRNQASYSMYTAAQYANVVNSGTFWGSPAGTAKMLPIGAVRQIEGEFVYWRVTYRIRFRYPLVTGVDLSEAWYKRVLHQGFRYFEDRAGEKVTVIAKDDDGNALSQPVLLAENGYRLASDADPIWKLIKIYPSRDFGLFGLN